MCRHLRWLGRVFAGTALVVGSARAQAPRRTPEVGQIIDVAVQAVIPSWERHAGITMSERGIRFDYGRTMTLFGALDDPGGRSGSGLTRAFVPGSDSLLVDCDQMGSKTCSRLGRSVYVYLEPITIASAEVVVWVHMTWANASSTRVFRASSSTEVFLSRSGSGPWTFVRLGRGVVS